VPHVADLLPPRGVVVFEELQYTLGEGPGVDACRQDAVVAQPDLAAHRGDPVHRGRRCPAPGAEPDYRLARSARRALLPVQAVKQVGRHRPPGRRAIAR
jgi:hypothetical protein